jgi:hypothetical protein
VDVPASHLRQKTTAKETRHLGVYRGPGCSRGLHCGSVGDRLGPSRQGAEVSQPWPGGFRGEGKGEPPAGNAVDSLQHKA